MTITGYVVDPPRVGGSNSPFTATPDVYVADQGAFDSAYPSDESVPRTEYHVFVVVDPASAETKTGSRGYPSMVDARFAWTKNEVIQRFDYLGSEGRFRTLPGGSPTLVGTLSLEANTTRLKAIIPLSEDLLAYPVRLSVGLGSGVTFGVDLVQSDASFSSPALGRAQLSLATGNLHWNTTDLSLYAGQAVKFQRQTFQAFKESNGSLGSTQDPLLLSPLPRSGQYPLVRIGFGEYLTPIERASEVDFSSDPLSGTAEWARDTGRLKLNAAQATVVASVYYDGVACGWDLSVLTYAVGSLTSPGTLWPLPPEASDTFVRIPGVVQFPEVQFVDVLTSPGKRGVVQIRRSDGRLRFSVADQNRYGGASAQAVVGDLVIERGLRLRLFRSPVNLANSDETLQDFAAFYASRDVVWSSPIIGSPTVDLPAIPTDTRPLTLSVVQGTGTFTTSSLPRLDVASPPIGLGYVLDSDSKRLLFAQRKVNQVIPAQAPYGGVQLPDPLLFESGLTLGVETTPGSSVYTPLVIGETALVDHPSGLVTMVLTSGVQVTLGSGGTFSGTTFSDPSANFSSVQPGDRLVIEAGLAKGVYSVVPLDSTTLETDVPGSAASNIDYRIHAGVEILADRYFSEVPPVDPNTKVERVRALGEALNAPRLSVDLPKLGRLRFRFGKTRFSSSVHIVETFTAPSLLLTGQVEISSVTGQLNFSTLDVGATVYSVLELTLGVDYTVQAPLGFVQLSERLVSLEEVLVTYKDSSGTSFQERASFLVRKEKLEHPDPTTTLAFNLEDREVAQVPVPKAWRGGRPQGADQVRVTFEDSTISFIGAKTVTDALPSGPLIDPSENIYLDYYVHEAFGGEQNFTVLHAPMLASPLVIEADSDTFTLAGDRTTLVSGGTLVLVDGAEVYAVGASSYDLASQTTLVTLTSPQRFASSFNNPKLAVTSGPVPTTATPTVPSYFILDLTRYAVVARGSAVVHFQGDVSRTYIPGTIILFTASGFSDYYLVSGSSYDEAKGQTDVTLTTETFRQYSDVPLRRSVRPIFTTPSAKFSTSRSPELTQPITVYRRTEGSPGILLSSPEGYTLDAAGVVTLAQPLTPHEEVGIFYTGATVIEAGRSFRASYTCGIAPNESNGLLNQTLLATYTTYAPDTFFWRVETFTNFRGELAEAYAKAAQASVPTGGPILANGSSPKLFEQGRPSIYYEEGYLTNEDRVARATLKYYNDAINYLENVLQYLDGRVVGDLDGRFVFDGNVTNPARFMWATVTNQIDDLFRVSPAPYMVIGPPFTTVSVGTYREVYKAAATSRFYPTQRSKFGATGNIAGLEVGDPLLSLGVTDLTAVKNVERRYPWAVITRKARTGDTTLYVDDANGSTDLLRPPFGNGMRVAILSQTGTVLVSDASSLPLSGVSATTLTVPPLPVDVPLGATVRLATNDTAYRKTYRLGVDLGVDLEKGLLTYLDPADPVWSLLTPSAPASGEVLDAVVTLTNKETSPARFPALDGATLNDDGNRSFPVLTPSASSEASLVGYIPEELRVLNSSDGTLAVATVPPLVSTGSLNATGTVITNLAGPWPGVLGPQLYDLVDIRTGPNSPSNYRVITSVGLSTITVNSAFPVPGDTGFTFTVAVSDNVSAGTAGLAPSTVIHDDSADFTAAGVIPGQTVILTTSALAGLRRQIVEVLSPTDLIVEAFPATGTYAYRISRSLATYGKVAGSITVEDWIPALNGLVGVLSSNLAPLAEIPSIEAFLATISQDISWGFNGVTQGVTLSSQDGTFLFDGVTSSDLVLIRSGAAAGVYGIASVDSDEALTVSRAFASDLSNVPFRVIRTLGLSAEGVDGVLQALLTSEAFATTTATTLARVTTAVPVVNDAGAYATRLIGSDMSQREALLNARLTQATSAVTDLTTELASGDRLYDKRYTWIDSRINLMNGILPKKERAKENRLKAQQDVLNQLTKLLTVKV